MDRNIYLKELADRLVKLPVNEREEAISFYTEYFEEADDDNAAADALGTPTRLAAQITAEYSARMLQERYAAQKSEQTAPPAQTPPESYAQYNAPSQSYTSGGYTQAGAAAHSRSSLNWIWYVVLGIFAIPVGIPILAVAFAVIVTVVAVCFVLIVAFVAVVAALFAASIYSFIGGFGALAWGSGILGLGGALASLGLALLLLPLLIQFSVWLVRSIGKLVSRIFSSLKRRSDTHEEN